MEPAPSGYLLALGLILNVSNHQIPIIVSQVLCAEHGILELKEGSSAPAIGEKLRLVPGYVDICMSDLTSISREDHELGSCVS